MDDRLVDVLQEIGLTQYQSRAYIGAVRLGTASFSTLSDEADIPQQRIYDVVDDLEEIGLVEVHEGGSGKEAVAVPPEVGLDELKQQHLDRFESSVETAIDDLGEKFQEVDASRGFVTVLNHESSVRRHVTNAIESADWWLFCSLPVDWYRDLRPVIRDALERDVTVRLLLQDEDRAVVEEANYPDGVLVRYRPSADLVVAADRAYGIFRGIAAPAVTRPSLVTKDQSMVEMFQRYSEQFWTGSDWIRTDHPYPRRYLTPWRALADHPEDLAEGAVLEAHVEGHETETGRDGAWSGPIVDHEIEPASGVDHSVVLPSVARLVIDTGDGERTVGGWDATLEDVAAHGLEIRRP
jgi:sugar-specific transcriptional regulator TrmB